MTSRRELLTLAASGAVAAAAPAEAASTASGPYAFHLPTPSLPVVGRRERFPVRRIYCVGRNYLAHIKELNHDVREPPFFFAKQRDMLVQTGSSIQYPTLTQNFHHEIELVLAMKGGGQDIPVEQAESHIYGYAVGLDMTRRDLQQAAAKKEHPWEIGKSFEQCAPCSPIRRVEDVGHINAGKIELTINGAVSQSADVKEMIWSVAEIIHHLSTEVGIEAGDLIYTGTPEGVGPVNPGDRMHATIERLPALDIAVAGRTAA
jgi:fumarylpyruvate hydrolase